MDRFRVEVIAATPNPQQVVYAAMHQDYDEGFVVDARQKWPSETKAGEIAVKRLLAGDRGHYGCYSEDTEVLTKSGWQKWDTVTLDSELLAVDVKTNTAKFEKPTQLFEYEIDDRLYEVQSNYLNLAVTPNHRMVVSSRRANNQWTSYDFKEAETIVGKPVRYLLNTYLDEADRHLPSDVPNDIDLLLAFKLAGFFFGDGLRTHNINPNTLRFRLRLPRKIAYLMSLGLEVHPRAGNRYTITHPSLTRWIMNHFASSEGKTIPSWLLTLPMQYVAAFWDGLKNSDGTRIKDKSWCYDSTVKEALDILQALAHINGFTAFMSLNNPGSADGRHKPCWRLSISERSTYRVETCQKTRSPGCQDGWINYKGKVYCASVSTGALLVRRKNIASVSGNSLEHPSIVFNVGYFPHSVMQQARTHRVGVSFDVQCLSADTVVTFVNNQLQSSSQLNKTMGELYDLFHNGEKAERERFHKGRNRELPGTYRRSCRNRVKKMRVRCLDEQENIFTFNHIEDVVFNGFNPIYKITLKDGKTLKCTQNHQIFTPYGWRLLSQLYVGAEVMVNGQPLDNAATTYQNDENNNDENNMEILCSSCHAKHHKTGQKNPLCAHPVEIIAIEYVGIEPTYDLVLLDPHHNFVANGVVVHNSMRYTGTRVIELAEGKRDIEDIFYLRPVGNYTDRQGKRYHYSEQQRQQDLAWCREAAHRYKQDIEAGMSEEHARGKLPFDYRQHFVVSFNLRSLMHFLDLRYKKDAQLEIQKLCELMWQHFEGWTPEIAQWYQTNRLGKARLSP